MPEYPGQTTKQNKAPTKELKRLVKAPESFVQHSSDGLLPAGALPGVALNDLGSSLGVQASRLGDQRLPIAHRQALATAIGQVQGNRHLQNVASIQLQNGGGASGGGAPVPMLGDAEAQQAQAQQILISAYGGAIKSAGQILEVDAASFHNLIDQYNIANNVINPSTKQPWASGDSQKSESEGNPCYGFTDPAGIIVIPDRPGAEENTEVNRLATIAHEILHVNSSADFAPPQVLGDVVEGATEFLAQAAMKSAGKSGMMAKYANIMGGFQLLADAVGGTGVIQSAYFGGASILSSAFDQKNGAGAYMEWQRLLVVDGVEARDLLTTGIRTKWTEDQIVRIRSILKNTFVITESDLAPVQTIWNQAFTKEREQIRTRTAPEIDLYVKRETPKNIIKGILGL